MTPDLMKAQISIQSLLGELKNLISSANLSVRQTALTAIAQLSKNLDENLIKINVSIDHELDSNDLKSVIHWIIPKDKIDDLFDKDSKIKEKSFKLNETLFEITVSSIETKLIKKAGTPFPSILIYVITSKNAQLENILSNFVHASNSCPIMLLVTDKNIENLLKEKVYPHIASYFILLYLNALPKQKLIHELTSEKWKSGIKLLNLNSIAEAVISLLTVINESISKNLKSIISKKLQLSLNAPSSQVVSLKTPDTQVFTEIKSVCQKQFEELENGLAEKFDNLIVPAIGKIWPEVNSKLEQLTVLDRKKMVKSDAVTIPAAFQDEFLKYLREKLYKHCSSDMTALHDFFVSLVEELQKILSQLKGFVFAPQFDKLSDNRLNRILESTIFIERPYRGELPRKGFIEYFYSARRYQIIFYMFASVFAGGLFRQYRDKLFIASGILLSIGIFATVRSVRKERIESNSRELEKARESLIAESRRICSEVKRNWLQLISKHLKDQIASILTQLDASLKVYKDERLSLIAEEKERLQRQYQAIATSEKELGKTKSLFDTLVNKVESFTKEYKALLKSELKNIQKDKK